MTGDNLPIAVKWLASGSDGNLVATEARHLMCGTSRSCSGRRLLPQVFTASLTTCSLFC